MRVAFFGGSFDPPHRGHVALVQMAATRLHLDRVLVAPVGTQPLKQEATTASFEDRVAMARLAFAGEPGVEVSVIDASRADGRPNYSIETVLSVKRTLAPEDELFYLMGADSWLTIGKWYRAAELLTACDFIVGARPGFDLGELAAALPEGISVSNWRGEVEEADGSSYRMLDMRGAKGTHSRLYMMSDLNEDVSATEVRAALGPGYESRPIPRPIPEEALDPAVERYIKEHTLYSSR
jgi:nicotinate-nucleotide adenylyltransferase